MTLWEINRNRQNWEHMDIIVSWDTSDNDKVNKDKVNSVIRDKVKVLSNVTWIDLQDYLAKLRKEGWDLYDVDNREWYSVYHYKRVVR